MVVNKVAHFDLRVIIDYEFIEFGLDSLSSLHQVLVRPKLPSVEEKGVRGANSHFTGQEVSFFETAIDILDAYELRL